MSNKTTRMTLPPAGSGRAQMAIGGRPMSRDSVAAGWQEGVTDGYPWQAKVYDKGSTYGINGGRVSKLCIGPKGSGKAGLGLQQCIYNYDCGKDIDKAPAGLVKKIIGQWLG